MKSHEKSKKSHETSRIYLGLGAGGMLGSASFGLTVSPKPQLQRLLLEDMTGFRVSGSCALRPHWKNSTRPEKPPFEGVSHRFGALEVPKD